MIKKILYLLLIQILLSNLAIGQGLNVTIEKEDILCHGDTTGSATAIVTGGTMPYSYNWSNLDVTETISNLSAGLYQVIVSDFTGTTVSASVEILEPEDIYVTHPYGGNICMGQSFYTYVAVTGGVAPYNIVWIGSDNSTWYNSYLSVSPSVTTTYSLIVTDFRGCFSETQEITVNVYPEIEILNTIVNASEICNGEDVTIELEITGGNGGPYTIIHKNNIINTPFNFIPLESGWYSFTVSDNCGSPTAMDSVYLTVNPTPQQYSFLQLPANGILQSGNYGLITLTESEVGTVYYIVLEGESITEEMEGTGSAIEFGNSFPAGIYKIMSRKTDFGCERLQGTVVFINENGIEQNINNNLKLFPNPTKEVLYFENLAKNTKFKIFDVKGNLVEIGTIIDNKLKVNNYSAGTYTIVLSDKEVVIAKEKFIVE